MGTLDAAYADLSSLVVSEFSEPLPIVITHAIGGAGTLNAANLTRTPAGTVSVTVAAVRSASRRDFLSSPGSRDAQAMDEWDYLVKVADLGIGGAGVGFMPMAGDAIVESGGPAGATTTYRVSRTELQVQGTMVKMTVRGTPVRA